MKPDQLIALAVRLFAIWLFLFTVRQLVQMVVVFQTNGAEAPQLIFIGFCLFLLALTAFMWFSPFTVSKGISTFHAEPAEQQSWTSDEVYGVGFVLLGTMLLFFAISDAVYWLFYLIWIHSQAAGTRELDLDQKGAIFATALELVFAIGLILGSRGLSRLIHRFRYGGLD